MKNVISVLFKFSSRPIQSVTAISATLLVLCAC
jgi:hypothetical protein